MDPSEIIKLQNEVAQWQSAFERAREAHRRDKDDLEKMRKVSNDFRIMMLSLKAGELPSVDKLWFATQKANWAEVPVDVLLAWLEVFQSAQETVAELVHIKAGKDALKRRAKEKSDEAMRAVEKYRNAPAEKAKADAIRKALNVEDKKRAKAIAGIMKALGVSEEVAREMVLKNSGRR